MSWQFVIPDLLRELRFFSGPSTCPWGVILLLLVLTGLACWWCGFICAAALFSQQCRRGLNFVARTALVAFQPGGQVGGLDLRGRLAEYQPRIG